MFLRKSLICPLVLSFTLLYGADPYLEKDDQKKQEFEQILKHYEEQVKKDPHNFRLVSAIGDVYYTLKNYPLAINYYSKALELEPTNNKIKTALAISYLNNNNLNHSKILLDEIIAQEPNNAVVLGSLGRIEALNHHLQEAEILFNRALDLNPKEFTTAYYLAELRIEQKRYLEAQNILKKLYERDPKAVWVLQALKKAQLGPVLEQALELQNKQEYSQALAIYQTQLKEDPTNVELYLALSRLYTHMGDYESAVTILNNGLKNNPEETSLELALGFTYLAKNDTKNAHRLFKKVFEKQDKGKADALAGLGKIAILQNKYKKAERYLNKSLIEQPNNTLTLSYLADLKKRQKDYDRAVQLYQLIRTLDPQATWASKAEQEVKIQPFLNKIKMAEANYQFQEVEKLYEQLIQRFPYNPSLYLAFGHYYAKQHRYKNAINIYLEGLNNNPENLLLKTALAEAYFANHQFVLSDRIYTEILKIHPENLSALTGKARIQMTIGNTQEAAWLYEWLLTSHPNDVPLLSFYADLMTSEGHFKKAEKTYSKILNIDPQQRWAEQNLLKAKYALVLEEAKNLEEQSLFNEVIQVYQELLRKESRFEDVYLLLSHVYQEIHQPKNALEILLNGLKENPQSLELQLAIAQTYYQLKNYAKAEQYLRVILKKHPDQPDALAAQGKIAEIKGHIPQAFEFYNIALTLDPHNLQALAYLAEFYLNQEKFDKAQELYQTILMINPQASWASTGLQKAQQGPLSSKIAKLTQAGKTAEAEAIYFKLIHENPDYLANYLHLGQFYLNNGRVEEAIKIYLQGLFYASNNKDLRQALGFAYLKNGQLNQAQQAFEELLKDDDNAEALAGLGKIQEKLGNTLLAENFYTKALQNDPKNITANTFLAQLWYDTGNFEKAQRLYEKINKLDPKALWVKQAIQDAKHGPLLLEIRSNEELHHDQEAEILWQQLLKESPKTGVYYLRAGLFYNKIKQYDKAIKTFLKGIEVDPKSSELYSALGLSYLSKKEPKNALKAFKTSYKLDSSNPDALAGLGYIEFLKGNYALAEKLILEGLAIDPHRIAALSALGELKIKEKKYFDATIVYRKLLNQLPQEKWIQLALDDAIYGYTLDYIKELIIQKKFSEAAKEYQKLLHHSPNNANFYYGLGQMYMRLREYQKSIDVNLEGLTKNSENNELRIALGYAYFFNKNLKEARKVLTKAVEVDEKNPEALAGLGKVNALDNNECEAEKLYWKAIYLDPKNLSALSFLSELLMKQKRYPEAQEIYLTTWQLLPQEEWVQRGWQDAEDGPLMDLANHFSDEERFEIALKLYLQLLENSPQDPSRYLPVGQTYVNLKQYYQGIDVFQKGLLIDPEANILWRAIAFTYILMEEYDSAKNIFLFLLEKDPDDVESLAGLGRIEAYNGSFCNAKEYYYRALEIDQKNLTALSYLSDLYEAEQYNFSGLQIYENINDVLEDARKVKPKWARRGYHNSLNIAFATLTLGGAYHEEDQWDPTSKKWSAEYLVYGGKAFLNYPIQDNLSLWGSGIDQFYHLKDLLTQTSLYSFDVQRFHAGAKYTYSPCFFIEGKLGVTNYSPYRYSSFKMQRGAMLEPSVLLTYHQPREKWTLGFISDSDLVARNFNNNHAKIVGYNYLIGTYERKILKRGWLGFEADTYWFRDYVNNNSQKVLGWFQWRPPYYFDYLLFRYHVKYQTFAKNIPDYYTYKPQIINHLQVTLENTWRVCWAETLYTSLSYGHGWQNTHTRFAQIIVVNTNPINQPYIWDNRQYDIVIGNLIYRCNRFQFLLNGDYYRDSEKYTIWSLAGEARWRF